MLSAVAYGVSASSRGVRASPPGLAISECRGVFLIESRGLLKYSLNKSPHILAILEFCLSKKKVKTGESDVLRIPYAHDVVYFCVICSILTKCNINDKIYVILFGVCGKCLYL